MLTCPVINIKTSPSGSCTCISTTHKILLEETSQYHQIGYHRAEMKFIFLLLYFMTD